MCDHEKKKNSSFKYGDTIVIKNILIFERLSCMDENGFCESTSQIKFGRGLPHINLFAIENKMFVDTDQNIYISLLLKCKL